MIIAVRRGGEEKSAESVNELLLLIALECLLIRRKLVKQVFSAGSLKSSFETVPVVEVVSTLIGLNEMASE